MTLNTLVRRAAVLGAVTLLACAGVARGANNWPEFRGPTADGHAPDGCNPPTKWSETDRVKWRTPIPGQGWSSPVVWGDKVWLTTSLDGGRSLRVIGADVNTGKLLHDVELFRPANPGAKHNFNSFASPSPVLEEGRVYVSFGIHGLACLDAKTADVVWKHPPIDLNFLTGAGSSPVLYKDLLILECDAVNAQFVMALDKRTGKEAWRTPRSKDYGTKNTNKRRAFSTAVVAQVGGRDVLLSVGAQRAYGYDPATGKELWHVDFGDGYSNVSRPLLAGDLLLFSTAYDASRLVAVRVPKDPPAGAPADLTAGGIAWQMAQGVPYKPSLTLVDGRVYMVADTGVARCLDPVSGKVFWSKRLGQAYSASPVLAGGHLYCLSEKGQVHVLKPGAGDAPDVVGEFQLEEGFMASPAVVGNALILRSTGHLYRVE